jgi:hypothetical protein
LSEEAGNVLLPGKGLLAHDDIQNGPPSARNRVMNWRARG